MKLKERQYKTNLNKNETRIHFPRGALHSSWKCLLLAMNEMKGEEGEQR